MRERLQAVQTKIGDTWGALDRNRRIQLAAIAAVFLLALGATLYLNLRTRMEVLVDNRDLTVVAGMQNALNDAGIRNRVVNNGRGLAVDQRRVVDAKVLIAQEGLLEDTGGTGFTYLDALNFSGMGTTETIKRSNMKKVKETELAEALTLFDGINRATVNLTIPDENYYFVRPVETARASAVLTVSRPLTKQESLTVARFLCASVKGLTMDNIEISDQNFNVVYSGLQESSGFEGSRYDQELLRKNDMDMKIRVSLAPLFDAITVINDNLQFNWDRVTEVSELITPPVVGSNSGVILRETTERQTSSSTNNALAPGLTANDLVGNTYQTANAAGITNASNSANNTEFGFNRTQRTWEQSTGALDTDASTIAVMVYRNVIYDESQMSGQMGGLTWDEFKANTRETPLDIDFAPISDIISKGTGLNAANISVFGYAVPVFIDAQETSVNTGQAALFSILALLLLMLAYGLFRGMPKEDVVELVPELSVEELLETTRMEQAKQAAMVTLQEIELDEGSEAKKLIEKFVNEKPEAVAQLMRNWLNDNWE